MGPHSAIYMTGGAGTGRDRGRILDVRAAGAARKSDRAFASALARFAIRRVKDVRQLGGRLNRHDVTSAYARRFHRLNIERLDDIDIASGGWKAALVEDRRTGPGDVAAARLDVGEWLRSLPSRLRRIAVVLSSGETTTEAARRFELSKARVSQLRWGLSQSWQKFQVPTNQRLA